MPKNEDLEVFRVLLKDATARIVKDCFLIPTLDASGGSPTSEDQERIYAYELYHQLRRRWPDWSYVLGREVDKRDHPLGDGPDLDNSEPNLLIRVAGGMQDNLAVLKIRTTTPTRPADERTKIQTDLRTLSAFCAITKYEIGILLAFGHDLEGIREHARTAPDVDFGHLELWHHIDPGTPARCVTWEP